MRLSKLRFFGFRGVWFLAVGLAIGVSPDFAAGGHTASSVAPETALQSLRDGNRRFAGSKSEHPRQGSVRRKELIAGQKPHTIVLSCSDSRVPPELIFDQGLGDLFVIRVAGNTLGAATVASIEYAVEHLGSQLIVVMGHESCGAIKAALNTPTDQSLGSPDLDALVSMIRPNLNSADRAIASFQSGEAPGSIDGSPAPVDTKFRKPVMSNVEGVAARLEQRSPIVRSKIKSGSLKIMRAIYGMDSGQVDFW